MSDPGDATSPRDASPPPYTEPKASETKAEAHKDEESKEPSKQNIQILLLHLVLKNCVILYL